MATKTSKLSPSEVEAYNARCTELLSTALAYAAKGFYVIPLHEPLFNDAGECVGCTCEAHKRSEYHHKWLIDQGLGNKFDPNFTCPERTRGKHARIGYEWEEKASNDPEQIRQWWHKWPTANIGIAPGKSGLIVLDGDKYKENYAGADLLTLAEQQTPTALSGNGGEHWYYWMPEGKQYGNHNNTLPEGIDIRGYGGLVVAPPSRHYSGKFYTWEDGYSLLDMDPLPLPSKLIAVLDAAKTTPGAKVAFSTNGASLPDLSQLPLWVQTELDTIPLNGKRSEVDYGVTAEMVRKGFSDDQIKAVFEAKPLGTSGKYSEAGERYLAQTISKARGEVATQPEAKFYKCTEMGNKERFIDQHKDRLRYVATWGKWLVWDGKRWVLDETLEVERLAQQTAKSIYLEAGRATETEVSKALGAWANKCQSREKVASMIHMAHSDLQLVVHHDQLDANPWLLNCENGTVNLKTGELRPHDRADLLTKLVRTRYNPQATAPLWERSLSKWMGGDESLVQFLQRFVGYGITGEVSEQCLAFLHGRGANGKSTFLGAITWLLDDYAQKAPITMLLVKKSGNDGIPNDIARLKGARFVVASEIEQGRTLAESIVKDLTGGDRLSARFLNQEFFEFDPTHKLIMYGNHIPTIRGTDDGIWRRMLKVPFTVRITEAEKDKQLSTKLQAEAEGILAWMVAGCLQWQAQGLKPPAKVLEATKAYREEMDILGQFIEQCCVTGASMTVPFADLHKRFVEWVEKSSEHVDTSSRKFGQALTERGFEPDKGTGNQAIRRGIGLLQRLAKEE